MSPFVLGLVALSLAQDKQPPRRASPSLFAFPAAVLEANRVACAVNNVGEICSALAGSPIQGGAFWPKGTPDQYIFSSGLQVAALIPGSAGFAWAGDTVGAYFFDARGDQTIGTPLADVFNSRDSADAVDWPNGAVIRDATMFDARLIGTNAVSEQDLWTRYWDGSLRAFGGGLSRHPMGLLVDQRLLAWNYPTGNQDIIYVVATLYNVTARTAGVYANATIPPELQSEIAAIGRLFQDSVEEAFAVSIPDGGYAFDSLYVQLGMDHDIARFDRNYSTASLPFGLGIGYTGDFRTEMGWVLPPDPFGASPFAAAPGLLGTVFLKAPAAFAIFTNTVGSAVFPDPVGAPLLWRRMSGNMSPSDASCTGTNDPAILKARHYCFLVQTQRDNRYQMSIGPMRLDPGEATTMVLAYVFAAPLDTANAYVGGDLPPGVPFTGDSIALDTTRIRAIERIAGWRAQSDLNGSGAIEAGEVVAARRSLMHKTQVAQALVDAKFLVAQPPDAPDFFLIPGDNQVTVVWQPSATEKTGDPYFQLASDRSSPLYDPNFRQFDVEGYRIYRGTNPRSLTLLYQFDHDQTTFTDYVGAVEYGGQCAPELGITTDCPVPFPPSPDTTVKVSHPILGTPFGGSRPIVQIPEGARIVSSNGLVASVRADTFPSREFSGAPQRSGVTYAFTDSTVKNSFRYYYAVTAFDFNSIRSGPSSFESPRVTKLVTPRVSSGQETAGGVQTMRLLGADGTPLDTTAQTPAIDPATGTFSGPMPPTDGLEVALTAFVPQLLGSASIVVTIDSIATGIGISDVLFGEPRPAQYYLSAIGGPETTRVTLPLILDASLSASDRSGFARFGLSLVDSAQAARFGVTAGGYVVPAKVTLEAAPATQLTMWGRRDINSSQFDPTFNSPHNGPRWWSGAANENTPDPNGGNCRPSFISCGDVVRVPAIGRTAGALPGVLVFHPQSYNSIPNTPGRLAETVLATVTRAADFRVFWGAAGVVDSVLDVTHRVRVPFSANAGASWGILTEESFAGVTAALTGDTKNTLLTWSDIFCVEPLPAYTQQCGGAAQIPAALQSTATVRPIAIRDTASSYAGTADPSYTQTGGGFIFYLNGHFFLMQLATPPAGVVWNARFYSGTVTGTAAQANFAFLPGIRPPAVPGLRARLSFQGSQLNASATTDSLLALVHTVPDPFYLMSGFEFSPDTLQLKFVHLPAAAIVRIYSQSGILVQALTNNDPTGGGELTWDLKNRNGRRVASGVYFYHVETMDRRRKVGRFTVVAGRPNR